MNYFLTSDFHSLLTLCTSGTHLVTVGASDSVLLLNSLCRILSPDKTEWRLISATLCGWRRCFVADQLWLMTHIRQEEEDWTCARYKCMYNNNNYYYNYINIDFHRCILIVILDYCITISPYRPVVVPYHCLRWSSGLMWRVTTDQREGSGDSEGRCAETDGRSQGRDWPHVLHLPRGLSQPANKGASA